jgi:hypothetical protein
MTHYSSPVRRTPHYSKENAKSLSRFAEFSEIARSIVVCRDEGATLSESSDPFK